MYRKQDSIYDYPDLLELKKEWEAESKRHIKNLQVAKSNLTRKSKRKSAKRARKDQRK